MFEHGLNIFKSMGLMNFAHLRPCLRSCIQFSLILGLGRLTSQSKIVSSQGCKTWTIIVINGKLVIPSQVKGFVLQQ